MVFWYDDKGGFAEDIDSVEPTNAKVYKLYFISDNIEKISNENIYVADKRDEDVQKRLFRMRFTFKNKKYDKESKYYLVAYDESNDVEVFLHEVIMDLAFSDNFGSGLYFLVEMR